MWLVMKPTLLSARGQPHMGNVAQSGMLPKLETWHDSHITMFPNGATFLLFIMAESLFGLH